MGIILLAYHEFGAVALESILELGLPLSAVFSYEDQAHENCWFRSVANMAREAGLPTYTTESINEPEWVEKLHEMKPDLLLSVYYRHMLKRPIRKVAPIAVNLHGSLLPAYRGRAPLNWQLVTGATRSGMTLHHMVAAADAGDIVDQEAIRVGPDETAMELYQRLIPLVRTVLKRSLPRLLTGDAPRKAQDHSKATVFGGRRPEDGRIDWAWPAKKIHDLVRAVAPPWPGAFTEGPLGRFGILRTRCWTDYKTAGLNENQKLEPGQVLLLSGRCLIGANPGIIEVLEAESSFFDYASSGARLL